MRASEAHDNNMDRHKLATRIRKKIHDVRRRRLPRAAQGNQQERQPQQELILRARPWQPAGGKLAGPKSSATAAPKLVVKRGVQ